MSVDDATGLIMERVAEGANIPLGELARTVDTLTAGKVAGIIPALQLDTRHRRVSMSARLRGDEGQCGEHLDGLLSFARWERFGPRSGGCATAGRPVEEGG